MEQITVLWLLARKLKAQVTVQEYFIERKLF